MTRAHVVVPWYREEQIRAWLDAWGVGSNVPTWLHLTQDKTQAGCGATKNSGVGEAMLDGAQYIVVLDDDCFPAADDGYDTLEEFVELHVEALQPQPVTLMQHVTDPPSRGTPFMQTTVEMPVAASMGFWEEIGDYDGVRQLAYEAQAMRFHRGTIAGRYFPLSGMNLAFDVQAWGRWSTFIDVPRFDDIWMGWMWQREAIERGACWNLNGPLVRHARQSNVWRNLQVEARHLERNESLWQDIATHPDPTYDNLCKLLPDDAGGSDR